MKNNSVKQVRVCLEEVAKIINDFIEEIIEDFKLKEAYKMEIFMKKFIVLMMR